MSENKLVLDTSALIEYFDHTVKGQEVERMISQTGVELYTPSIVIAELISKLKRKNLYPTDIISKLDNSTEILALDDVIAKKAGELHADLKKKNSKISLADCVIMAHGSDQNAVIVTCDHHFKNYPMAKILE